MIAYPKVPLVLILLLSFALSSIGYAQLADPVCPLPSPLTEDQITPEQIGEVANKNKLNLDQMVCCLPESWRKNFVVATTSVSAQSSDPHAPRIILYPPTVRGQPVRKAVSFLIDREGRPATEISDDANSAASQKYSIEMMDSGKSLQPRFSDIQFNPDMAKDVAKFTHRPDESNRHSVGVNLNSPKCTTCHGDPASGTYPLFSKNPIWPNTFPKLTSPTTCPTESEMNAQNAERRKLVETLDKGGTAYNCLPGLRETILGEKIFSPKDAEDLNKTFDQPTPPATGPAPGGVPPGRQMAVTTGTFEIGLNEVYNERVMDGLKASADWARYRYALAGALIGCFNPLQPDLKEWFPTAELERQSATLLKAAHGADPDPARQLLSAAGQMDAQAVERAITCTPNQQTDFQTECLPQGCPFIPRLKKAVVDTLSSPLYQGVQTASDKNTGAAAAQKLLLGYIAKTNIQEGRTWTPVKSASNRDTEADAWGTFKYLMSAHAPETSTTNEIMALFNGGETKFNTPGFGLKVLGSDPELKKLYGSASLAAPDLAKGCKNLLQASKQAFYSNASPGNGGDSTGTTAQ